MGQFKLVLQICVVCLFVVAAAAAVVVIVIFSANL
jgi:hypothetical protein